MQKERDKADAYRKAAYEGDAKSMNNLGVCYHRGLGVKENHSPSTRVSAFRLSALIFTG